jgi:predicted dehydrogenase
MWNVRRITTRSANSYLNQEEPLKTECQHFLDCINHGTTPVSCGARGTELVRILEASSESLQKGGAPVPFAKPETGRCHSLKLPIR